MTASPVMQTIAVLGGTGKEGKGLALRWAKAGYRILIGSRSPEKAIATSQEILESLGGKAFVEGTTNLRAAHLADIVVLTVPYAAHRITLENVKGALQGKILVDVTVPLVPPNVTKVQMPPDGSAAQEAHNILGENAQVTSAFQNIAYEQLLHEEQIECDVLVTGTSKAARAETIQLVTAAGFNGWDAGPLENSVVIEGMTSVLININKQYGSKNAGIKIVGASKG
jgi:8-hydroxy-5-deazaflavin:NADPH oxidoreductase